MCGTALAFTPGQRERRSAQDAGTQIVRYASSCSIGVGGPRRRLASERTAKWQNASPCNCGGCLELTRCDDNAQASRAARPARCHRARYCGPLARHPLLVHRTGALGDAGALEPETPGPGSAWRDDLLLLVAGRRSHAHDLRPVSCGRSATRDRSPGAGRPGSSVGRPGGRNVERSRSPLSAFSSPKETAPGAPGRLNLRRPVRFA